MSIRISRRLALSATVCDISLLTVLFGFAYFFRLDRFPLIGTDEARYLEIPREMIERGDFITPTLNYVPYFEKPPLHYWLNALATLVFGETAFAARFFGALWGVLGILLVYHLGRKLFGRWEGWTSALILGTAIGFTVQGRTNITDTTLTFFLSAALGCFLLAIQPQEKNKRIYYHLFYVGAALAVLAKGLIGIVLPVIVILSFLAATKRWSLIREMQLETGSPLFFLVSAPWFILVSLRNPQFLNFFFIHEHFARYLTGSHQRYQPFWFYVPVLFGCMLPWSFFIPTGVKKAWQLRSEAGGTRIFLLLWVGVVFLFFSFSNSKLIPYILPIYPALALLIGVGIGDCIEKSERLRIPAVWLGMINIVMGIGAAIYPILVRAPRITATGGVFLGTLFVAQGIAALFASRSRNENVFLAALVTSAYVLGIAGPPVVMEGIAKRKLVRELALMVNDTAEPNAVVASVGYQQELPLYTKRRVVVIGDKGELEFGSKQGNNSSWFLANSEFASLWVQNRCQFLAVVPRDSLDYWARKLVPVPRILGVQGKHALISNRAERPMLKVGMCSGAGGKVP